MSEKRKPSHDLARFKQICGDPDRLTITRAALTSATRLGFGRIEIAATIRSMERRHFYKSMTSFADHRQWQDVYRTPSSAGVIYVKFTDDVVTEFILLSFKEKDDG
jgi:motility quorum-sensing regulator/GCU-specific mRNA interferase toxin